MEIELSKDISENIEIASKQLGLEKKEIITRALILYLKNLRQYIDLQEELEGWEQISSEDSANLFEKHNL